MRPAGQNGPHHLRASYFAEADGVAICLTGALRTLMTMPVRRTYRDHVATPLALRFRVVHTHAAIVLPYPVVNAKELSQVISAAYEMKSLELLTSDETMAPFFNPPKWQHCRVDVRSRWSNARGDASVLAQWSAVGRCYNNVERAESDSKSRYAWLIRLRTDQAFFADVPLVASPLVSDRQGMMDTVFVPSHGMTGDPAYRCMNDQTFLCPRHLCRPYFRLLELFTSAHCNASSATSSASTSIFATDVRTPHGADGPPRGPYTLPMPPSGMGGPLAARLTAQWYFFARYSSSATAGKPCQASDTTERCCGMIREVAWPYSIARRDARTGRRTLECTTRLASYAALRPANKDFLRRPTFWHNTSALVAACRSLEREWFEAEDTGLWPEGTVKGGASSSKPTQRQLRGITADIAAATAASKAASASGGMRGLGVRVGAEELSDPAQWDLNESSASHARVATYCAAAATRRVKPQASPMGAFSSLEQEIRGDRFCDWLAVPPPSLTWGGHHQASSIGNGTAAAPPALILGAHLTRTATKYFPLHGRAADLHTAVDRFVTSPAVAAGLANGTLEVHVVHDAPQGTHQYKGVVLHHVTLRAVPALGGRTFPAQDARWGLYGRLLAALKPDPRTCVFMVDFRDVLVLRASLERACASADEHPAHAGAMGAAKTLAGGKALAAWQKESSTRVGASSPLFVGSDMCMADGARKLLRYQVWASYRHISHQSRRYPSYLARLILSPLPTCTSCCCYCCCT